MEIQDGNLFISPLTVDDVFQMRQWGKHETPLLSDYNFPDMTDTEARRWYRFKTMSIFNKYFGIKLREKLIGYMGIKHIRRFKREATLGIVFDPNYINKGYGTKTLTIFLDYYFNEMDMNRMYLEVNKFNTRAFRLYEKMGFKVISSYYEEFDDQNIDQRNPYFIKAKTSFVIIEEKIYNYIYKMKLDKEDFQRQELIE